MSAAGTVRPAGPDDIAAMQRVSRLAGELFASVDDPRVSARAADPPPPRALLAGWVEVGRAWVSASAGGDVVGYLVADVVDGNLHVEDVAVVPDAGGRGHGTALLSAAVAAARSGGQPAVTLTTFADVPFNRPWYERRGFAVLPPDAVGPELAARVREEADLGLDPAIRVCMRRPAD